MDERLKIQQIIAETNQKLASAQKHIRYLGIFLCNNEVSLRSALLALQACSSHIVRSIYFIIISQRGKTPNFFGQECLSEHFNKVWLR